MLLNRTLEDLCKRYPIGLYEFLYKHKPHLYGQLIDLEDRITHTYLNKNSSIDVFKAVIREYWTFHMTAIKEFKQVGEVDLNLPQVREEMSGERIRA
ncbi:MAG: hypothetical protein ACREOW_03340 [Thermodesulfobacteriota bacterium]